MFQNRKLRKNRLTMDIRTNNQRRMSQAVFSDETRELMGLLGEILDVEEKYIRYYERVNRTSIPDGVYDKLVAIFMPVQEFFEKEMHERLNNFVLFVDAEAV